MNPIYVLWATPRSTSTAFEWMMRMRGDMACFHKDMPQFTDHLWQGDFLDRFEHSFLIRDPARVLASLQRSWTKLNDDKGFTRNEIGFDEQRKLFDLLCDKSGSAPVVIDSDDLLTDPPAMVARYCASIGVSFIAVPLSWEPGSRSEVLWYDGDDSIWHESLKNSNGLKAQPRKHVGIDDLPPKLQALYHDFLPHYQHLYAHRLRP